MFSRRELLAALGITAAGLPLMSRAWAAPATSSDLRFLFVFNPGGWDPTRVFAAEFDNGNVDLEPDAERAWAGDIPYVHHPSRPSVDSFLAAHHQDMVVLNGVMVRSIAHEICTIISMTGGTTVGAPDWPAILAAHLQDEFILPHLVVNGPSYPGELGVAVARTGVSGQLEALLSGRILDWNDRPGGAPSAPAEGLMDRYMNRRLRAHADGSQTVMAQELNQQLTQASEQAAVLKDLQYSMDFTAAGDLASQGQVAIDAFLNDVSRCVTIAFDGGGTGWDTHTANDDGQTVLWEGLFAGLAQVMGMLAATPGRSAPTMADETVVVVLSEMGRTPQLNGLDGKDHWPFTSTMVIGPNVSGGRVIGGFDESYYGRPIDNASGELYEGGQLLAAETLGATLLAMADIDPAEWVSGVDPLMGMLK